MVPTCNPFKHNIDRSLALVFWIFVTTFIRNDFNDPNMKRLLYLIAFTSVLAYGQGPLVIAHRGGAGMAPENTLAAFQNAVEVNADYFELDVMISSDDSLMIMHDATVDRTTDGSGNIASMTYEELRTLDAGSWFGAEFAGEKIPTLRESLMIAKNSTNDIGVVVEIKSSDATVPSRVVETIQQCGMQDRVIVSSFSLAQITEVKSLDPTMAVQLFGSITESNIDQMAAINGEWVGSGSTLTQDLIDYAHVQGIYFNAWTLNAASTMLPAIELGVDAITTDFPVLLHSLMDETEPSDVVLTSATPVETRVFLEWEPATDEESGIAGYDIFRDESPGATTLLVSLGNVTEYEDDTRMELQQYYYRIKARNVAGLNSVNYSNEIGVVTGADMTPPGIVAIHSRGDHTRLVVRFSERVEQESAETDGNYVLSSGASVEAARLARDQQSVMLTTTPLSEPFYLITVKDVKDRADTPNAMVTDTTIFLHEGLPESAVAFYTLDSLYADGLDYQVIDGTENENTGVARNGVFITEGILGNGLGFDGVNDYVEFPASPSFNIDGNAVSVSLWAKLPHKPSELPGPYAPLFDSETDNYVLYGDRGNNELRFKVTTSGGAERPGIPGAEVTTGEWMHIVGVYDGSQAMIYLNGELKDSHPITGTVNTGQVATMGRTGSTYLQGSLDQVEIYEKALTEEEIIRIYEHYRGVTDCGSYILTQDVSICSGESYTFPDGAEGAENMEHVIEVTSPEGCHAIVTITLTIKTVDVSISQEDGVITAGASGAAYRWLDCDNGYAEIQGETGQSFAPSVAGNYAVEVTVNGCTDTSSCVYAEPTGISLQEPGRFVIYPNPGRGIFTLELGGTAVQEMNVEIINAGGKRVYHQVIAGPGRHQVDLSLSPMGIYLVRISDPTGSWRTRLIIL